MTQHNIPLKRMPVEFGPAPGPRQVMFGDVDDIHYPKRTRLEVHCRCRADDVADLLPPALRLQNDPRIIVEAHYLTEIPWLAGRGYNILRIRIPALCRMHGDDVPVHFIPVLWENRADPIMTGREEIGYPKLYCEISDCIVSGKSYRSIGSWDGFHFLEIEVADTVEDSSGGPAMEKAEGIVVHKYIPRTGSRGEADADYLTFSPAKTDKSRVFKRLCGQGRVSVNPASWQELPTLCHVVNRLARIDMSEVIWAGLSFTEGGTDLGDQSILAPS